MQFPKETRRLFIGSFYGHIAFSQWFECWIHFVCLDYCVLLFRFQFTETYTAFGKQTNKHKKPNTKYNKKKNRLSVKFFTFTHVQRTSNANELYSSYIYNRAQYVYEIGSLVISACLIAKALGNVFLLLSADAAFLLPIIEIDVDEKRI